MRTHSKFMVVGIKWSVVTAKWFNLNSQNSVSKCDYYSRPPLKSVEAEAGNEKEEDYRLVRCEGS